LMEARELLRIAWWDCVRSPVMTPRSTHLSSTPIKLMPAGCCCWSSEVVGDVCCLDSCRFGRGVFCFQIELGGVCSLVCCPFVLNLVTQILIVAWVPWTFRTLKTRVGFQWNRGASPFILKKNCFRRTDEKGKQFRSVYQLARLYLLWYRL
jgi:hypothetical protein